MARLLSLLAILAAFLVGATASVAANGPPHDFPGGFSIPADFKEDVARRTYFDFDTYQFDYPPAGGGSLLHTKVDGHLWHAAIASQVPNNNTDVIIVQLAAEMEKDGWTVLRRQGTFVARKAVAGHDLWVMGNGASQDFRLNLIQEAASARSLSLKPPAAQPETVADDQDLPYFLPLPGSKAERPTFDHRAFEIRLPGAKDPSFAVPSVTRWYDEPPGVSSYEFVAVYRAALEAAGWDVTRATVAGDSVIVAHYGKNGRDIWLYTHGDGGKQNVNVADYGAESANSALRQQLARDGHVALYGIYFDTDSATPRPESETTLQNVLALLKADPSLKLEVQGHTDSSGAADHNQTLSDARAKSVVAWLTGHGIGAGVLTGKGYGATMPVADNANAEGKAKNRRVELVSMGGPVRAGGVAATPVQFSGPGVVPAAGANLTCSLPAPKGNDHPVSIANSAGRPLASETIINIAVKWRNGARNGEDDDCFAINSVLTPGASVSHTITLQAGQTPQTCEAYVSARIPSVVHTNEGGVSGSSMECDPR